MFVLGNPALGCRRACACISLSSLPRVKTHVTESIGRGRQARFCCGYTHGTAVFMVAAVLMVEVETTECGFGFGMLVM